MLQTKVLVMDLVAAGNTACEGPDWSAFKATIAHLDLGAQSNPCWGRHHKKEMEQFSTVLRTGARFPIYGAFALELL